MNNRWSLNNNGKNMEKLKQGFMLCPLLYAISSASIGHAAEMAVDCKLEGGTVIQLTAEDCHKAKAEMEQAERKHCESDRDCHPSPRAKAEQAEAQRKRYQELARAEQQKQEAAKAGGDDLVMVHIPGKNYEMGKYEVTQREWEAVMGNNPSKFGDCGDNCPVERVSWDDIQIFLEKLNARTGKQYRLPTEEEWEYACHGGSQTKYCGGNDIEAVGWHAGNSSGRTHPAGQKQANGYGLYDMTGNAWEWVSDCWSKNCAHRVFRGGAWSIPGNMLDTDRYGNKPAMRGEEIGFRIARTLP